MMVEMSFLSGEGGGRKEEGIYCVMIRSGYSCVDDDVEVGFSVSE